MTGSMFCTCPHCGSDLRGGMIPGWLFGGRLCPHGCGQPDHYSRLIGQPPGMDATEWQCPDCGKRWER